jgi:hypothetical protein
LWVLARPDSERRGNLFLNSGVAAKVNPVRPHAIIASGSPSICSVSSSAGRLISERDRMETLDNSGVFTPQGNDHSHWRRLLTVQWSGARQNAHSVRWSYHPVCTLKVGCARSVVFLRKPDGYMLRGHTRDQIAEALWTGTKPIARILQLYVHTQQV